MAYPTHQYEIDIHVFVFGNGFFSFVCTTAVTKTFIASEMKDKLLMIEHFLRQKNEVIFHIIDKDRVSWVLNNVENQECPF